jgi:malonyl-CoA O-methyltransferase
MMALGGLARLLGIRTRRRLTPQEAYGLWADTYPPWPHNPLMQAEQSVVVPLIAAAQPRRALDVGTGTGRCLPLLAAAGARLVVGVDLSPVMLERGRRGRGPAPFMICADACRLPFFDASFDVVSSSLMAGDVEDLGGWLREASRVLARGGSLIYSDFHPSWAERGWQRTFRTTDGQLFELPYRPHTIEQHLALLESASLGIRTIREPRVSAGTAPVVAVFHALKPR